MVSAKEGSSFRMPPEEQRFFQLISDYQRGKLTLEEAVPLVREASHALRGPINMSMPPSVRRLFAEVAKLDGRTFPEYTPRPDRHADGGGEMRHRLAESAWEVLRSQPRPKVTSDASPLTGQRGSRRHGRRSHRRRCRGLVAAVTNARDLRGRSRIPGAR